jgi:hypothetical protein
MLDVPDMWHSFPQLVRAVAIVDVTNVSLIAGVAGGSLLARCA